MARLKRFILPGQPQHVIQRGNNREDVFFADKDYHFYEEKLLEACHKYHCEIHAYVLMTNHIHLLMTPYTADGISRVMQSIGRFYVQYINRCHNRTGSLWEGRYKASLIDSEAYLLTCMRYIELNPVRAEIVTHPGDYRWSSYDYNALGKENSLVTPHLIYRQLAQTTEDKLNAYEALFEEELDESTLSQIRDITNKSWVLGSDRFRKEIEKQVDRKTAPRYRRRRT